MEKITLKNGVRIVLVPNKATSVVTVMAMFGVGSRHETDQSAGISHVLEHMNYKGTKKRPTFLEVAEFIESIGGEHNAFTNKEYTAYYTKVTPKHLEEGIDFISDNVLNSTFDPTELKREKNVIIEEIKMYEDLPMENIANKFEEALFGQNALGRDIIGTQESVRSITSEDLINYRKFHYTASNCVVVLAGNFGRYSNNEIREVVEKNFNFSGLKPANPTQITLNLEKSISITPKQTEQSHLIIGFYGAPFQSENRFALKLLGIILGGSMSSRMFVEIRERRGLAYAVRTSVSSYREAGLIETQAGVPHSKVIEATKAVLDQYNKIKQKKVAISELNKAKEIINGRTMVALEDSLELASHYATWETIAGQTMTPKEILAKYEEITPADILKAANKYLVDNRMSLAYIGPALKQGDLGKIFRL
jgi:predicted Zn-dependent peptidase